MSAVEVRPEEPFMETLERVYGQASPCGLDAFLGERDVGEG